MFSSFILVIHYNMWLSAILRKYFLFGQFCCKDVEVSLVVSFSCSIVSRCLCNNPNNPSMLPSSSFRYLRVVGLPPRSQVIIQMPGRGITYELILNPLSTKTVHAPRGKRVLGVHTSLRCRFAQKDIHSEAHLPKGQSPGRKY